MEQINRTAAITVMAGMVGDETDPFGMEGWKAVADQDIHTVQDLTYRRRDDEQAGTQL